MFATHLGRLQSRSLENSRLPRQERAPLHGRCAHGSAVRYFRPSPRRRLRTAPGDGTPGSHVPGIGRGNRRNCTDRRRGATLPAARLQGCAVWFRLAGSPRGVAVAANFLRSSSASSTVSARSKIVAGSPFGTTCRIRSWTCCSLSRVSRLIVNWTLNRSGASGVTAGRGGVDFPRIRSWAGCRCRRFHNARRLRQLPSTRKPEACGPVMRRLAAASARRSILRSRACSCNARPRATRPHSHRSNAAPAVARREVQAPVGDVLQQGRKPSRRTRHLDPVQRRVFRVMEHLSAVRE